MFSLNIDKRARSIASLSLTLVIAVTVTLLGAAAPVQTQGPVPTEEAVVSLISAANGKCLQPINQSHNQGDAIVQQACNGSTAQQWTIHGVSGTTFHLINGESGLCLDARGEAVDGTPIQQWTCNQISNENWTHGSANDLLVSAVSNTSSHCITASGSQDGLPMQLRKCDGDSSQRWRIQHTASSACAGNSGKSPLDVVWTDCDQNGFPLNPEWQYEVTSSGRTPPLGPTSLCPAASSSHQFPSTCISWPVTYDNGFWCGPHVNYFAVTFQGPVEWWQRSAWGEDDDYNFFMYPPNNMGAVNPPKPVELEIEFDSEETINYFHSPLWNKFHDMVDNNNSAAQAYVKGHTAVVTSLFGLDCGHPSCGTEEHPAFAMALNMDDSILTDDQWAVFARNWGDEGFCGDQEHTLPIGDLKMVIPWVPGATAVTVLPNTHFNTFIDLGAFATTFAGIPSNLPNFPNVPYPQVTVANGEGILIDFTLPDPSFWMGWEGEVHLQWTLPLPVRTALANSAAARRAAASRHSAEDDEEKPESGIGDLYARLPAAQQATLRARFTPPSATANPTVALPNPPVRPVATLAKLPAPPRLARPVVSRAVNNPRLAQRDKAVQQALCEAYKNNVPGYPSSCTAAPPAH